MNVTKTLTEKIIRGSLTVVIFTSIISPIGYLIKMIYSRSLSIEMFGLFYAIYAFFILLSSFTDLGFGYSLIYLIPKYYKNKDYKTCWKLYKYNQIISVAVSAAISIITIISADWLSTYYFKVPEAKPLIYIFAVFLISGGLLAAVEKLFMGLQQEKYYSTTQSTRMLFTLTISLFLWLAGNQHIIYYATGWSVASILAVIIYSILLERKNRDLISRLTLDKKLIKVMSQFALPSLLTTTVFIFITSTDMFFLTLLKDVHEVATYSIVVPLATISSIVLTPLNTYLLPLISHLMEEGKDKVQQLVQLLLKIIPFIGFYFALFVILFPSQTISILFGQKWVISTKIPLTILSIGYVGAQLSNFLGTIVYGLGKVKKRLKASLIIAVINIVFMYVLISRYSVLGLCVASSIVFILSIILNAKIIQKSIKLIFPYTFYLKLLIIGALLYAVVYIFKLTPNSLLDYFTYGIVYTGIMVSVAYFTKLFDRKMLKLVFKI